MSPAAAADQLIRRVRREVAADLEHAALFGSRARGDARPDSDYDILLVFRELPTDREPCATDAEALAQEVSRASTIPINPWSISLVDFGRGRRTPMLVDALDDALPLWSRKRPLPRVRFTPDDALFCTRALLDRVRENGGDYHRLVRQGELRKAAEHAREDVTRLCTAGLLMRGITRPRRDSAVRGFVAAEGGTDALPREVDRLCRWAISEPPNELRNPLRTAEAIVDFSLEIRRRSESLSRRGCT